MSSLSVDAPTVADAPALSAMAQASFRATFAYIPYPEADLAVFLEQAMGVDAYRKVIEDPDHILRVVKNAGGDIVGFIKLGPNGIPLGDGEPPVERTRALHQLYLLDEAKGSGMADALTQFGKAWAQFVGAEALYLTVHVDNHRAQRFYARHGFSEIGQYPFAVGNVIDDDRIWKCAL